MVTGNALFLGMFNNLAFFILLVAVYGVLYSHFKKASPRLRQAAVGLAFGLLAIACMHVKIPVAEGVIFDQRNTVVALSGAFGGPLSAVLCAFLAGSYRIHLGGTGALAGVIGVGLSALAGAVFYNRRDKIDNIYKAALSALAATVFILPGFLFYKDLPNGWVLLKAMALPYGAAVYIGLLFVGLLLARQEKSHLAQAELQASERRYRDSQERLDLALSGANEGIWDWDIENNTLHFDHRYYRIAGYSPGEFPAAFEEWEKRVHPDDVDRTKSTVRRYLAGNLDEFDVEFRFLRQSGDYMWIQGKGRIVARNDQGEPTRFIGTHADITLRKQLESSLLVTRFVFEKVGVGIYRIDSDARIIEVNDKAAESLGYTRDELAGMSLFDIDPTINSGNWGGVWQALHSQGMDNFETTHRRKDGHEFPVEINSHLLEYGGQEFAISLATDISSRKRAEDSLKKSERLHRKAQQIARLGHWEYKVGEKNPMWSDEMYRIFEMEKRPSGVSFDAFFERVHPEDRTRIDEHINRAIENRTGIDIFNRVLLPDGSVKYVHGLGHVECDNDGNPVKLIGTVQDVTKLKEAEVEKEKAERRLLQAQKMEAIGTLAGGIAHDFNNILSSVIGFTQISIADLPEGHQTRGHLERVLQAGLRARDLVSHILAFSRQREAGFESVQVHAIIREVIELLRASIPANIEINQRISPHCCPVLADPTQIHQIMMNLCTNAHHAIGSRKGRITISLEETEIGPQDFPGMSDVRIGRHVKLGVSDTGHGMDQDTLRKVFDPYFTTKKKGKGTGVGLAVVHGIVKKHGGHITAYSEPGQGTSFYIYLPCAKEGQAVNQDAGEMEIPGGTEHILVVDDEKSITEMLTELLSRLGYRVTAFADADQAIDVFQSQPDAFDLIITDMTMPAMNGEAFSRRIRETDSQVPVIIQTGFSEDLDVDRLQSIGVGAVLKKPILERELAQCIRNVLDKKSA